MDWNALKASIEQSMANGSWQNREFEVDGHKVKKNSLEELIKFYQWVCQQADISNGTSNIAKAGYTVPLRNVGSGLQ